MENRKLSHSQIFLKSRRLVETLIEKTDINNKDLVVEIGPGNGIITEELSKKAGRVIGVEYDRKLASDLKAKLSSNPNIEIIEADFLAWNLPTQPYKVFANIPFNMTADIVSKLLNAQNPPEVAYLIMQDLAAKRFIGEPVESNSQISILLQPFYDMCIVTKIDRTSFTPTPNINAVLAKFEKRKNPKVNLDVQQLYRDFVIYGYNQWQPTVSDSFRKVFTSKQLGIMNKNLSIMKLKSSELSINQWIEMFNLFMSSVPEVRKSIVKGAEKRLKLKQSGMQKQYRTRRK